MEDRGARPGYSRKRIRLAESSVLRSASPVLDRAVSRPRVRQGERHESLNHHQRGADPTSGTDRIAFRAPREASKTLRNLRSIYIKEFTSEVQNGKITI